MCGIFGSVGSQNAVEHTLKGLKKLEYRGYDSSGIAGLKNGRIYYCKEVGKISVMEEKSKKENLVLDSAIAHTRWATHGKPTLGNAHPHFDVDLSLAVVHNGIIENYSSLRSMLMDEGIVFSSHTDTEVIAHLIAKFYEGDVFKAIQKAMPLLEGAYAIALIHQDHPDTIYAFAKQSPLVLGIGDGVGYISSDANAFDETVKEATFLENSEMACIRQGEIKIFNATMDPVQKQTRQLFQKAHEVTKAGYEHFTLKEIFEQPDSLRAALAGRCLEEYGISQFSEFHMEVSDLIRVERVLILACGTSYHAGMIGALQIESLAKVPVQVEIASEYRYKDPILQKGTLVIAISQSGETADLLAAVRELKAKGAKVLSICNVQESSLARESDSTLFLRAGVEVGVCSTKAFTSQLAVLSLFALLFGRTRHLSKEKGQEFLSSLLRIPEQVAEILAFSDRIEELAKKYSSYENFFYIGRHYQYPAALEGALKIKEISYVNANAYPAGEMKHGPIALIDSQCLTVAFCANRLTQDKLLSNIMEIKARDGSVLAIVEEGAHQLKEAADDWIEIPATMDPLSAILTSVVAQLFAYFFAKKRGTEIDQPRNLAKSVTVE